MEKILFLSHTDLDGNLPKLSLEILTSSIKLAKASSSELIVGIFGKNAEGAANSIASCEASKFLIITGPDFEISRYSTDALACETLASQSGADVILCAGTSRISRAVGGASLRVNGRADTRISKVAFENNALCVERWYYRQRMVARFSRKERPWFLVLDGGLENAFPAQEGKAAVEVITVEATEKEQRTEFRAISAPQTNTQTIKPEAEILLVAGAGWTKKQKDGQFHVKEAENLILKFLEASNASLGSSKSLVDQKSEGQEIITCMSHLNQVGQTGATPRHQKGLSTCCHGEEPHVVGWRFINERRAINLDPNCGWAQGKADVLYVADAFEVISKVNELLSE